jgi:hypothetical protein
MAPVAKKPALYARYVDAGIALFLQKSIIDKKSLLARGARPFVRCAGN